MKIIVTSEGKDLESNVDQRFGRARYFILVDTDSMEYRVIENEGAQQSSGAGVKASQIVIDSGAKYVLTGNCGPTSFDVLRSGGVEVIVGVSGKVKEAVEKFKRGELKPDKGPNVSSHHGL